MPAHLHLRLKFLTLLLVPLALLLLWRLVDIQVVRGAEFRQRAARERVRDLTLFEPPRGSIADAHGFPLAFSEPRYRIVVSPPHVRDAAEVAEKLSPILQIPAPTISATIASSLEGVVLAPYASLEQGKQVMEMRLSGVSAHLCWLRHYPHGLLAAPVLGFTAYITAFRRPKVGRVFTGWKGTTTAFSVRRKWRWWPKQTRPVCGRCPRRRGISLPPSGETIWCWR